MQPDNRAKGLASKEVAARAISGIALGIAGFGALAAGGFPFSLLCAAVAGAMVWELHRVVSKDSSGYSDLIVGSAAFLAVMVLSSFDIGAVLSGFLILLPSGMLVLLLPKDRIASAGFGVAIVTSAWLLSVLRDDYGVLAAVFLVATVVATDVVAFFGGRLFGGPKLCSHISPGKTWSGAISGLTAACAVGSALTILSMELLIVVAALLSVASQLGDLAESWFKRRHEVKDSSGLIPGHGGFLDRFDGMIGACCLFGCLHLGGMFPELAAA